jgi:hypothetical protein
VVAGLVISLGAGLPPARAQEDVPPAVDPGTPTYAGVEDPVPDTPVAFDVANPSGFGTELNQYNVTTHDAVTTTAMRVTVQTRSDAVGTGALQWKVLEVDDGP